MVRRTASQHVPACRHVALTLVGEGQDRGYRFIIDVGWLRPLVKELGLRALAGCPSLSDVAWELDVSLTPEDPPRLEVRSYRRGSSPGAEPPLAALRMPLDRFQGLARGTAKRLGLKTPCACYVEPLDPLQERALLAARQAREPEDPDFRMVESAVGTLRLPKLGENGLRRGHLGDRRRVLVDRGSWLRCVFSHRSIDQLLAAASAERERERGFGALGEAYLAHDGCWTVVQELIELPVLQANRASLLTSGKDFLALHRRAGGRLVGYAHLHPRTLEGDELLPVPSGPDQILAWDWDGATSLPTCFPIALFETDRESPGDSLAVHAFEAGKLRQITVEVLK